MATPARAIPQRFLVAFSFAGEQRDLVRAIAEKVESELGRTCVFFDEWYEHYLAGDDADLKLQDIYGQRCALAVVCVSERYGGKPWTKAEHTAIRARHMTDGSSDRMIPIRVGDGDVPGILFNAIVPDVRKRSIPEAAQLIIDRLRLVEPLLAPTPAHVASESPDWPENPPDVKWPVADHTEARAALEKLLTRNAPFRILPVEGPSELGKTHMTKHILGNALRVPGLACGRFDFKGITGIDAELRAFVEFLDVPVPQGGSGKLSDRLSQVLEALKQRARPAFLVFDTYEAAGEAADWVERQLLTGLIRTRWLRVVIVGQRVPRPGNAVWSSESSNLIELHSPPPEDWFHYGQQHNPELTLEFVCQAHKFCGGKASTMAALCGPRR